MKLVDKFDQNNPIPPRMMPTHSPPPSGREWEGTLSCAFRDRKSLLAYLGITSDIACGEPAGRPLLVPRPFADKMAFGQPDDPLLRQVLPRIEEHDPVEGFTADPVDDRGAEIVPGLLKKYQSRALLMTTSACAIHCRFCFRSHYLVSDTSDHDEQMAFALKMLAHCHDLNEVILSGGDPLMLDDAHLGHLFAALTEMTHIRTVRIHTRMPTVLPCRIQAPLLRLITSCRKKVVIVLHVNHPAELGADAASALQALVRAGALLLNQSVLLKAVNDDAPTLIRLSHALLGCGVMPYYLHQLDRTEGTHHFEVRATQGVRIVEAMREQCPGYLVPRYVQEVPGAPSKCPIRPGRSLKD